MENSGMVTALKAWRVATGQRAEEAAKAAGVTLAMWSRWETGARRIPAERAAAISALTGVELHILRPDVFPAPEMERAS